MIRLALLFLLLCLSFAGCSSSKSPAAPDKETATIQLMGSWTNRDKTRFLEITKGGSVVINKKGDSDEDIGFYEINGDEIRIFKDRESAAGRTEIARFEILSDNEVVFGENKEYWNVVNITGRWYRQGSDINKIVKTKELEKLSPEEKKLVEIQQKRKDCEELIKTLEGDRKSYLVKISRLDEEKQADSWRLNASMLAKTKRRLNDADYELKKLKRAEEALATLIADQQRASEIKKSGLDEKGLEDILRSIGKAESELPIKEDTEFELRNLVEEELKTLKSESEKSDAIEKSSDKGKPDPNKQ